MVVDGGGAYLAFAKLALLVRLYGRVVINRGVSLTIVEVELLLGVTPLLIHEDLTTFEAHSAERDPSMRILSTRRGV